MKPSNLELQLTLIGTRVFEQNDLAFLEMQTSLLSQEQIGTLDNEFKVRFAIGVDKRSHVRDIDSLRSKLGKLSNKKIFTERHTNRPPQGTNRSALNRK